MRKGTTPLIKIHVNGDLTSFARVVVTMKGNKNTYDYENDRLSITEDTISFRMTQEETLSIGDNAEVQIRAVTADGVSISSGIGTVRFGRILKNGILEV